MSIQSIKLMLVNDIVPFTPPPPLCLHRFSTGTGGQKTPDKSLNDTHKHRRTNAGIGSRSQKNTHIDTQVRFPSSWISVCVSTQVCLADAYGEWDENCKADSWHKVGTAGVIPFGLQFGRLELSSSHLKLTGFMKRTLPANRAYTRSSCRTQLN